MSELEDKPTHLIEGIVMDIRDKAVKIDSQWYPISTLEYGREDSWKIGEETEVLVYEWFLIQENII